MNTYTMKPLRMDLPILISEELSLRTTLMVRFSVGVVLVGAAIVPKFALILEDFSFFFLCSFSLFRLLGAAELLSVLKKAKHSI